MDLIDPETEDCLNRSAPDDEIGVIIRASPEKGREPSGDWSDWVKHVYLKGAVNEGGFSRVRTLPNLRTIVATGPVQVIRKLADNPGTKSIRLQPPDEAVEFLKPVRPPNENTQD